MGKLVALSLAVLGALVGPAFALHDKIDSPMYQAPELDGPPVEIGFPDGLKEIWLRALARPEAEMRLKAASTIALARERGVKGLDATIAPLIAALDVPEPHPTVRLAIARTLVVLDAKQAAPSLLALAESGSTELREIVEPALARWDHKPARAFWIKQLGMPPRSLALAIQCLGIVREENAVAPLLTLAVDRRIASPTRVEAASALGAIRDKGLEKDAEALLADGPSIVDRLAAALMLRRHSTPEATALLLRLARDPEPGVVVVAASRLIDIDAKLGLQIAQAGGPSEPLLASPDPQVRLLHVELLFRLATPERVGRLAGQLQDAHPDVRIKARQHLHKLAERKDLRPAVLATTSTVLAAANWQGLEQAAILLTELDHKPAATRLAALLENDRPEVFVTAAWGLRRLAVPETYPPITKFLAAELKRIGSNKLLPARKNHIPFVDHELSQLCQLLGKEKHTAADPVLRGFIPKTMESVFFGEARAAAIWALGLIHEGKPDAAIVAALEGRLTDVGLSIPPESPQVHRMCAVTIGRMKAEAAVPTLRKFWTGKLTNNPTSNACGWAIREIAGEPIPAGEPVRQVRTDWFLVPIK